MKLARNINRGVVVAAALLLAMPALAHANPLLSGYGGPGQGSQALLGATLTGPRGGGGSGNSAGSGGEGAPSGTIEAPTTSAGVPTQQSQSSGRKHTSTRPRGSRHNGTGSSAGAGSVSGGSGPTQTVLGFAPARRVHTDTAGISGGDLALILLGIAVVAATGFSMARLARGGGKGGQLKP